GAYAVAPATPEVTHRVAVLVVPLHPRRGKLAHAVSVDRGVPGLGDELDVAQDRVLADGGDQVAAHVDHLAGAGERAHQVEAETVHAHLGDPVAQRVEDEPQALGVGGVDGVPTAGDVPVGVDLCLPARARGLHHTLVVAEVVEAAE